MTLSTRLWTVLLLPLVLAAAPPDIHLPGTVTGAPGDFIQVHATTTGAVVKWVAFDTSLKVFPVELLKSTQTLVVTAAQPGSYRLLAYTSSADGPSEPAYCTVVVIGVGPPPPPPPPPPDPSDPLTVALQAAATSDGVARASVAQLAALYRQVAATMVQDPTLKTYADLFTTLKRSQDALVPPPTVLALRKVIGAELNKALGTQATAPLDRALAARTFARLAVALEGVK